jgi:hypothetical protein
MRKSLTRTLAGVAAAAATVLALAGPANAAPVAPAHQPRVHTTLSIVQSRNVIKAGQKDIIGGRLVADHYGLPHKFVYLDRWFGKWVPVRVGLTGPHGWIAFAVWPQRTAHYKLVYLGNQNFAPTYSGVVTARVVH